MKGSAARREAIVERLADHILEKGLQGASLRPLAAASGTSDRMLLYYFADKNELVSVTLASIAERLMGELDGALTGALPFDALLPRVCELLDTAPIRPYMRLWLEIAALASRDEEPFRSVAGRICDGFLAWMAARLEPSNEDDSSRLMAMVEGMVLLNGIGRGDVVAAALSAQLRLGRV